MADLNREPALPPSPCTQGEGWGEGIRLTPRRPNLGDTLSPALSLRTGRGRLVLALLSFLLMCSVLRGATPVTVTLDTNSPGPQIPDDFAGFSLEIARVLPDANGKHVFSPQNVALVSTYKQLGVKS